MLNSAENQQYNTDFNDIYVNGILMAQCKDCGTIVTNGGFHKWKHCQSMCSHKLKFKISSSLKRSKFTIGCLICNNHFNVDSLEFMEMHRQNCKQKQQKEVQPQPQIQPRPHMKPQPPQPPQPKSIPPNNQQQPKPPLQTIAPKVIQLTNGSKVFITPTMRPKTQNITLRPVPEKPTLLFNLKKHQYNAREVITKNGKQIKVIECQICMKMLHADMKIAIHHRSKCNSMKNAMQKDPEVLMSVQTTHTDNIINEKENNSPNRLDNARSSSSTPTVNNCVDKSCFVCGSTDNDCTINMGDVVSLHSKRNVVDIVWGLLNKASARIDTINASGLNRKVICKGCLTLINKLDAANEITKALTKKLTNSLEQMDKKHEQALNEVNTHTDGEKQKESEQMDIIDLCDDY